jgi:antagonist of KipI
MTSASASASLVVVRAGLHTTVQDAGRWGYQHMGVPVGGALDLDALRRGNGLVGNVAGEAALEVTLVGCLLEASAPLQVAVTGARFDLLVNGTVQPPDAVLTLSAGDQLVLGHRRRGARAYVAVRGGVDAPIVLGSRSAWPWRPRRGALMDGDRVPVGSRVAGPVRTRPWPALPFSSILRVLPGPDLGAAPESFAALCGSPYRLLPSASRMAYPLEGAAVPLLVPDRSSSGTVTGAIQILPSGLPVLLMAERQTTGGYPVAAVVIGPDLRHAAQLAPGDVVRFRATTRVEAMRVWREAEARWEQEA